MKPQEGNVQATFENMIFFYDWVCLFQAVVHVN